MLYRNYAGGPIHKGRKPTTPNIRIAVLCKAIENLPDGYIEKIAVSDGTFSEAELIYTTDLKALVRERNELDGRLEALLTDAWEENRRLNTDERLDAVTHRIFEIIDASYIDWQADAIKKVINEFASQCLRDEKERLQEMVGVPYVVSRKEPELEPPA